MKKILCLCVALVLMVLGLAGCNGKNDTNETGNTTTTATPSTATPTTVPTAEDIPYEVTEEVTDLVIIDVNGYGKIVVELYPETAPITVENFKNLVSEKFYDGLIFHRIIKGFMIQGGGYTEDWSEKNSPTIKGEFSSNGVENDLKHTKGVISMARTPDPNSASSQFFIMHEVAPHLDGEYAAFGNTVYGIEVVDAIASVRTNYSDMPLDNVVINSIRFAKAIN